MDRNDGLIRIGVFSTLTRISVRMLHHYQKHDVLAPAYVDPFTGHRFYQADQLGDAVLLVQLRNAGFSIEKAAEIIRHRDPSNVEQAVAAQREALTAEREQLHDQFAALDHIATLLKGKPDMTEVSITSLPAMHLASVRKTIPTYGDEGMLWEELFPLLTQAGASFPAGGISGATFHDSEYRESDVDVEVWMQVTEPLDATAPLVFRSAPERKIVTATLHGDYAQMPSITEQIGHYIAEHRLETTEMFNIYRVSPAQNPDPSSWVTDVCFTLVER